MASRATVNMLIIRHVKLCQLPHGTKKLLKVFKIETIFIYLLLETELTAGEICRRSD